MTGGNEYYKQVLVKRWGTDKRIGTVQSVLDATGSYEYMMQK